VPRRVAAKPIFSPAGLLPALRAFPDARRCWLAYSGGMDSRVLLHALVALGAQLRSELRAIHVDHGLQSRSADWAEHCRAQCDALGVPLELRRLTPGRARGESREAAARQARYAALRDAVGAGDILLTAQHLDDQAETLLLALLRGSGVKGLAAMPALTPFGPAWLLRPLLDYPRSALLAYAREQGLDWVEDPSNADLSYDRNFLRARVLPLLAERWPACAASLARSASHCAEAQHLVEQAAEQELARLRGTRTGSLSACAFAACEPLLGKAVLRHWIAHLGLPPPGMRQLERIRHELLGARADRSPLVAWPGCEVRRYRDDLFAMPPLPAHPGPLDIPWGSGVLGLPEELGRLVLTDSRGRALDPASLWPQGLRVRFAVPGLSCRPAAGARRRQLKQLYQEAGVPPWLRPYVPCLFLETELLAVGDLWCCGRGTNHAAARLRVRWDGGIRTHPAFPSRPAGAGDPDNAVRMPS
jgi:tRNA(Ile)-lysidine synthase